jgi:hypothetical protein
MPNVARRRPPPQACPRVDAALEARIDACMGSFVHAPDPEARMSAWRGFLALRAQRTAAHVAELEDARLQRVAGTIDDDDHDEGLGDLLGEMLLAGER